MAAVSIIVPVYNVQEYLLRCLNSLSAQTLSDIEIIIVNDGSTDESGKIIDYYASIENRAKVVHKKNGGISSARNAGLEVAEGEYCLFVDADDWLSDCAALELCNAAKSNQADIVIFNMYNEYTDKRNGHVSSLLFDDKMIFDHRKKKALLFPLLLSTHYLNSACNKMYSIGFIRKKNIIFDEDQKHAEDLAFNLQAFSHADLIVYLNTAYYHYLRHEGTITTTYNEGMFDQLKKLYKLRMEYCNKWEMSSEGYMNNVTSMLYKGISNWIKILFDQRKDYSFKRKNDLIKLIFNDPLISQTSNANFKPSGTFNMTLFYAQKYNLLFLVTIALNSFFSFRHFLHSIVKVEVENGKR